MSNLSNRLIPSSTWLVRTHYKKANYISVEVEINTTEIVGKKGKGIVE